MPVDEKVIQAKLQMVQELKENFRQDVIKAATFSIGGERRTFFSLLREKEWLLVPMVIRNDYASGKSYQFFNPPPLMQSLEKWGFHGVVLGTDETLYHGNNSFVSLGKQVTNQMPFVRLDLFVDPVQVYESFAIGADGIFIKPDNPTKNLIEILKTADDLSMDILLYEPSRQLIEKIIEFQFQNIIFVWNVQKEMEEPERWKQLSALSGSNRFFHFIFLNAADQSYRNFIRNNPHYRGVIFAPGEVTSLEEYIEYLKMIKANYGQP